MLLLHCSSVSGRVPSMEVTPISCPLSARLLMTPRSELVSCTKNVPTAGQSLGLTVSVDTPACLSYTVMAMVMVMKMRRRL